ncbi:ABC-type dipeptide/oligopeptide/nickel transport system ATPase subunit [Marinobacter pelagius]|uniref:ABC-type dipeptide/oligopeptide/nickel transport system ATPase subunit n=1 Tax=Marinobacter pelagius TaxID=379482 RepID=A0A366GZ46_9GAMM|nr:ATP-binding cassette domain-containing protein [Marinobacter pelagius]RBP33997.1 ABC-type dipeptide/oligopeptide/nickel transport system ATPase subunit [Marinobacter pelagius]
MSELRLDTVSVGTLKEVSLQVGSGAVVCISGASGSGKSRLLRAVADLEPHDGRIYLDDIEQVSLPAHEWRKRVVMIPADSQWWFDEVGAHFAEEARHTMPEALGFPPGVMDWPVSRLSSGERQRLALWRALAMAPEALLLDEPTANLDEDMTAAVEVWLLDEIRRRNLAVLWVAHDQGQIRRVANHHYRISGSQLEWVNGSY